MTSIEGNTEMINDELTTINYPTNGLKIRRVKIEDIRFMKIADKMYKAKLFNMKNMILEYNWNEIKQDITILKEHSLYHRISRKSYILCKKGFYMTIDKFENNDKATLVKVINECIDYIEEYSDFEEIPIDTLLQDTE